MIARRIHHCNRTAGHDQRTVDRHIGQRDCIRPQSFCNIQVAFNGRIGQRAALRYRDIDGICFQIRSGISPARGGQRGSHVVIQDLGNLAARDNALRTERIVAVARDKALVYRGLNIAGSPVGYLAPVAERQVGRGDIARVSLEQAADDRCSLLARDLALRVHPVVARAVYVAVFLRNLDGLIIPCVGRHIGIGDRGPFCKMECAVDIAHELGAGHIAVGFVFACCRAGIDYAFLIEIFNERLRPMPVQIGGGKGSRDHCHHGGERKQSG